ncbi:hypothetical protein [Floridanema aerugineum]|uniref:Uncharacterized protein n=1 Tax=Floridaenema aerugineum BLCC-F46 TaxID=3153654 RepID=A0ABV4XEW0_9CYAN
MKLSNQHKLMILEATGSVIIGLINTTAGIIFTIGVVGLHLHFDNKMQPFRCPLEQTLKNQLIQPQLNQCKDCPLLKALNQKKRSKHK